ncbi:EpsG family protein [Vibrio metschnikovii]|uniref:EpsG family protein n=1 Tax=Vibrio metschnikovii TaxID=28172 RepID=UPI00332C646B
MTIYFSSIFIFLVIGYCYNKSDQNLKIIINVFCIIILTMVYGFRFEVGADWFNYIHALDLYNKKVSLTESLEIGYRSLNILSASFGYGIIGVNVVCSFLFFLFTIIAISRLGLNPYFFLAIVAPYHLVMSGMNYTRQSVAISFVIMAVSCFLSNNKKSLFSYILLAATFHKSAIIFIILGILDWKKRFLIPVAGLISSISIFFMFNEYSELYISSSRYDSSGLILRYGYLIFCFIIILGFIKNRQVELACIRIVQFFCISVLILALLSLFSTTAADRLSYYYILIGTFLVYYFSYYYQPKYRLYYLSCLFSVSLVALVVWAVFGNISKYYIFKHYFFIN